MMSKINVKALIKSGKALIRKRTPEILTGVGIAGMVTTTVLAVKATPKAMQLIEERKLDLGVDKLPKLEVVKTVWPCYIPAAISGAASISCIVGASSVNMRRNAALAAGYALSESTLKDYQEKIVETVGEKKMGEIQDAIAKDKLEKNPVVGNEVIVSDSGDTLCYEPMSGRYFRSSMEKLKAAINELNNMMINNQYISVNDFYTEIGIGSTSMGDDLGWRLDADLLRPHFASHIAENGEPCIVVSFLKPPTYDYDKYL